MFICRTESRSCLCLIVRMPGNDNGTQTLQGKTVRRSSALSAGRMEGVLMDTNWTVKGVLKSAALSLRHNYIACLAVIFVMVIIAGQYGGSTQFIASYDMLNVANLRVDAADKRLVADAVVNGGMTPEQASDKFNIGDAEAVKNWADIYREYGENALNAKELTFFHSGNESSNWAIIDDTVSLISGRNRPITAFVSDRTLRHEQQVSDSFDMLTKEYSPHFQVLAAFLAFFSDKSPWDITVTCVTSLFSVLVAIFVSDTLIIGERRFFLENRYYRRTHIGRMGFMIKERFFKPLKTIVLMHVFRGLWFLTVIGGFYKTFEYYMIPFILAENPNIGTKKAFALSKAMMKGSKRKALLLNASFLLIEIPIIVVATLIALFMMGEDYKFISGIFAFVCLGVARIFFLNAFRTAADTELYIQLRRKLIAEGHELCTEFTDELIDPEILEDEKDYTTNIGGMTGAAIKGLTRYPGADQQGEKYIGITKKQILIKHDYHRNYLVTSFGLMFFVFSTVGWFWEVVIHIIEDGELVNRGTLHGPWLPIYGVGGIAGVLLLKKFRDNPAAAFTLMVIGSGIFEYLVSLYFDKAKGLQYWNYNGYFLNINGRVCFEGLIVFGFAGMLCLYILGPVIDDINRKLPRKLVTGVLIVLFTILAADVVYSFIVPNKGKGITDYAAQVVDITQISSGNFIG